MPITYPISLSGLKAPRRITLRPRSVVGVDASPFTLQAQSYAWPGQLWMAEVQLPPMARADAEAWVAALVSLNGREGSFLLGDTANRTPRGTATGTPLVKGAGQTGYDLITDGWTAGIEALKRGDWVQLGSGSSARLYKVTRSANTGTNLLLRSEAFDNTGAWTANAGVTVAADVAPAPDQTLTADRLIQPNGVAMLNGTSCSQLLVKAASALAYALTVYCKKEGLDAVLLRADDNSTNFAQASYNLNTGAVITTSSSGFTLSSSGVESIGNGWYRCRLLFVSNTSTALRLSVYPNRTTGGNGNGVDGVLAWGAQLEQAASAGPYNPTTSAAKTVADETTVSLWPKLRSSPADNAPLVVNSPVGRFMLADEVQWDIDELKLYGLSFTAVEDLRP